MQSPTKALAPEYYCRPDIFDQEQIHIFSQHWWLVGATHELAQAGDYIARKVGKFPVFIVRDEAGAFRGFHNTCRHRAGPIVSECRGRCPGKLLVCQYHGWSYDFQGGLKNAHSLNDLINKKDYSLYSIRVEIWNGLIFACTSAEAVGLSEWLGDIEQIAARFPATSTLSQHGILEKKGSCNWKCYGDNSCEGYHVGLVHQTLRTNTSNDRIKLGCFDNGQFVGFDVTYSASTEDSTRQGSGYWIYKFPGLLLHFSEFTFNAECVMPVKQDQIELSRWFWVDSENAALRGVRPDEIIESASTIMDEDLSICEKVYANLDAGKYQPGTLCSENEPGTIFLQKLIRQSYKEKGIR